MVHPHLNATSSRLLDGTSITRSAQRSMRLGQCLHFKWAKSVCVCHITHTHTHNRFTALWNLSGTTRVSRYQEKHSPTHTHRGHQSSQSASPSTVNHGILRIQSTCSAVFFHNLSPLHTPYFFTQSLSSFRSTCPYHRNLFHYSTDIMSSNSSLPLNSLLGTLSCNFTPHILSATCVL